MHATYKNALMWTLYGVLFLLIAVLQTVVLSATGISCGSCCPPF